MFTLMLVEGPSSRMYSKCQNLLPVREHMLQKALCSRRLLIPVGDHFSPADVGLMQ